MSAHPMPPAGVSAHAVAQMAERYRVAPSVADWNAAVLDIIDGRALLLRVLPVRPVSRDRSTEIYALSIGGMATEVVWSPRTGCIVTVLPRSSRSAHSRDLRERRKTLAGKKRDEARRVFATFGEGDEP